MHLKCFWGFRSCRAKSKRYRLTEPILCWWSRSSCYTAQQTSDRLDPIHWVVLVLLWWKLFFWVITCDSQIRVGVNHLLKFEHFEGLTRFQLDEPSWSNLFRWSNGLSIFWSCFSFRRRLRLLFTLWEHSRGTALDLLDWAMRLGAGERSHAPPTGNLESIGSLHQDQRLLLFDHQLSIIWINWQ